MNAISSAQIILAQAEASASGSGGGILGNPLVFFILIMAAMYFLMIAPQRKKQKQHQQMLNALESGDIVLTAGGIYGEITNKKDDRFVIRIADNTKIEVAKGFIQTVVRKANAPEPEKK